MAHGVEVGHCGAHPDAVHVVRRRHPDPCRVWTVRVFRGAKSLRYAGCVERSLDVWPSPGLTAPHGHRSISAMEIISDIQVTLRLSKERQDLGIGPFIVSKGGPSVKVLR